MEAIAMSDQKDKVTKVVTREEVIRFLADDLEMTIQDARKKFRAWEKQIKKTLAEANEEKDVSIHIFDGIRIESKYLPLREKVDNLTGKRRVYQEKIKPTASVTRRYMENLNGKKTGKKRSRK